MCLCVECNVNNTLGEFFIVSLCSLNNQTVYPLPIIILLKFLQVKNVCMVSMPFILFWSVGMIFQYQVDYLIKLGLFVLVYLYANLMSEFVFDDRLFNILPLSIYFSTKFYFYLTWLYFVLPHVNSMTTMLFLFLSSVLWYNFMKAWKGDPGLIKQTEDQRYRAIIELAERSNEKNPFDPKIFCTTCLVKRPIR